jgi:hypothetical protein
MYSKKIILFIALLLLISTFGFSTKSSKGYYLFVYFTGNVTPEQQICYAVSDNGVDFTPLNDGRPIIASDTIAVMKAVRDPHILRGHDDWFYMVATDMDWTKGKWSNHGIVMMRSRDLICWEHHAIDFHKRFAGKDPAKANAVWAPQSIWDPFVGKNMIYFSLHSEKDGPYPQDAVYYAYADSNFSDIESDPQPLFKYPYPTIDTDIVQNESGTYHLFFNTWGGKDGLTRRQYIFTDIHDQSKWTLVEGRMQPNDISSEGSCAYPLAEGGWMLIYDCFKDGFYQFCKSSDLLNFNLVKTAPSTGLFTPRHGTVLPILKKEYEILKKHFK